MHNNGEIPAGRTPSRHHLNTNVKRTYAQHLWLSSRLLFLKTLPKHNMKKAQKHNLMGGPAWGPPCVAVAFGSSAIGPGRAVCSMGPRGVGAISGVRQREVSLSHLSGCVWVKPPICVCWAYINVFGLVKAYPNNVKTPIGSDLGVHGGDCIERLGGKVQPGVL